MSKQHKTVPKFATEAEERAFSEKNDSANCQDWTKAAAPMGPIRGQG